MTSAELKKSHEDLFGELEDRFRELFNLFFEIGRSDTLLACLRLEIDKVEKKERNLFNRYLKVLSDI